MRSPSVSSRTSNTARMSVESGMRDILTTSTPTHHSSSFQSMEITLSGRRPNSLARRLAACSAITPGSIHDAPCATFSPRPPPPRLLFVARAWLLQHGCSEPPHPRHAGGRLRVHASLAWRRASDVGSVSSAPRRPSTSPSTRRGHPRRYIKRCSNSFSIATHSSSESSPLRRASSTCSSWARMRARGRRLLLRLLPRPARPAI